MRYFLTTAVCSVLLLLPVVVDAQTTVLFEPSSADVGPYPADVLTSPDPSQKTGLRVELPAAPVCLGSDFVSCDLVKQLLNQLDGFSVKPQIRICFSGPIDTERYRGVCGSSEAMEMDDRLASTRFSTTRSPTTRGTTGPCGADQQSPRTSWISPPVPLTVTSRLREASGAKVVRDEAFEVCLKGRVSGYCGELVRSLKKSGIHMSDVVGGSLFTTMSATAWMEKARQFLYASPVLPTIFPAGPKTVFDVSDLQSFEWLPQTNITEPPTTSIPVPLQALGGVQRVAFGLYLSPNFVRTSGAGGRFDRRHPHGGPDSATCPCGRSVPRSVSSGLYTNQSPTTCSCHPRRPRTPRFRWSSTVMARGIASLAGRQRLLQRSPRPALPRSPWKSWATVSARQSDDADGLDRPVFRYAGTQYSAGARRLDFAGRWLRHPRPRRHPRLLPSERR